VGIIGAGVGAAISHIPHLRATGRAEVVAIARRNPERLALVQRELSVPEAYTDWREMLDKSRLAVVVVCTPHNAHVEPTLAALERGLHVLIEKPVTDTIAGARALVQAAEQSKCVVTVGEDVRGMRSWRGVKRSLVAGTIGTLRQINLTQSLDMFDGRDLNLAEGLRQYLSSSELMRALSGDMLSATNWRTDSAQLGGDSFSEIGAHSVDLLLWLGGAPAQQVVALRAADDIKGTAILTVQARLANGVLLSITYNDHVRNAEFSASGRGQLTALGSLGSLSAIWNGYVGEAERASLDCNGVSQAIDFEAEGETVNPATAFVATVLDGAPNFCSIQASADVVSMIQSAYRSVAESRIVTLAE
jgi:predicted dehydrogenase